MTRDSRVHSICITHGGIVVEEPTLHLLAVSRNPVLYCRNWAQIRRLPQKGVLGVYLERYSFPPWKTRVRSTWVDGCQGINTQRGRNVETSHVSSLKIGKLPAKTDFGGYFIE